MNSGEKFYVGDFILLILLSVAHATAQVAGVHKDPNYNLILLMSGYAYWGFHLFKHNWNHIGQKHHFDISHISSDWFGNVGNGLLFLSFIMAPLVKTFDFTLTASEGVITFTLLTLSLQPYRYFLDELWKSDESSMQAEVIEHPVFNKEDEDHSVEADDDDHSQVA
jgi:hypothetical protein